MKNKVIAISGYSGSGKTTVGEALMTQKNNYVYFDFGYLFRPLTFYMINDLKMSEATIKEFINSDLFKEKLKFSYRIIENKVEIGINGHYYTNDELFSLDMNMKTVVVGSIVGDKLSDILREIIDDLKKYSNVLLNARRPVEAYPNLDYHIFLKSTFEKRLERKIAMNKETYEITKNKLLERDKKEQNSGFWETFDFTKIIDTTNMTKADVLKEVLAIIDKPSIKITSINNLTLVLGSYKCNKNCPYCIAKNNKKFSKNDDLEKLEGILKEFKEEGIRFNRFVLSGNGEPSMYKYEELLKIRDTLISNLELFDSLRVHSSGNIFLEKEKLKLFSSINYNVEFEVLRISLNDEIDRNILGYNEIYTDSDAFKECNSIKCDLAITDYLDIINLKRDIGTFLNNNPNISKIRLKKLLVGDNDNTPQAEWVKKHSLSDEEISKIIKELDLVETPNGYKSKDGKIIYTSNGNYENDIVFSDGKIQDYSKNTYKVKTLKRKFGV